jgi:hypothetical protein
MVGTYYTQDASKIVSTLGTNLEASEVPTGRGLITRGTDLFTGESSYHSVNTPSMIETELVSSDKDYKVGALTRRMEGGNYGATNLDINPSAGKPGQPANFGRSYGAYQFNINSGLPRFLKWLSKKDPAVFALLKGKPGSAEFNKSWEALESNEKFRGYQDKFWQEEYLQPTLKQAKEFDIKTTDRRIVELLGSSANQRPGKISQLLGHTKMLAKKNLGKELKDLNAEEQLKLLIQAKKVVWSNDNDPNRPFNEERHINEYVGEIKEKVKSTPTTTKSPIQGPSQSKPKPAATEKFSKYVQGDPDEKKVWLRNIENLRKQGKDPYQVFKSNPKALETIRRLGIDIGAPTPVKPKSKKTSQLTPGQQNFLFNSSADASGANMRYHPIEGLDNLSGSDQNRNPMTWMFSPPTSLPNGSAILTPGSGMNHKLMGNQRANITDGNRYKKPATTEAVQPIIIDNSKTNNIGGGTNSTPPIAPRTNDDSFRRYMDRISNFSNIG